MTGAPPPSGRSAGGNHDPGRKRRTLEGAGTNLKVLRPRKRLVNDRLASDDRPEQHRHAVRRRSVRCDDIA
jgi:hypothetical protein